VKSNHFGINYKFDVTKFLLQDFKLHAQDYFNATHSEATESKAMKLSVISMDRSQLMKENKTAFVDEILWRVVGQLVNEVFAKNKVSIATNVFAAAANHTVTAVRDVAASAARGVTDTIIAHNPKELIYMANRAMNRRTITPARTAVASTPLSTENDPAKIGKSGVSKLRVRLIAGRGLKQADVPLESPLVCSVRIVYPQNSMAPSESIKSHPKRPDDDFVVSWDETITVGPILSMDAQLHVRVFEFHLLKDSHVCEAFLPLMSPPAVEPVTPSSPKSAAPHTPSNPSEEESSSAPSKSKLAEFVAKASSKGTDANEEAAAGAAETPSAEGEQAAASDADGAKSPAANGSSTTAEPRKQAAERKLLMGVDGVEVEGWYKCYGRQTGVDRHKEKGELHLALLLE
jgi:hypothetical protein